MGFWKTAAEFVVGCLALGAFALVLILLGDALRSVLHAGDTPSLLVGAAAIFIFITGLVILFICAYWIWVIGKGILKHE